MPRINRYLTRSNTISTGVHGLHNLLVQNPDPNEKIALASHGQVFRKLIIPYGDGPRQWPRASMDAINRLRWPRLNASERYDALMELLVDPFNTLFPPATLRDAFEWQRVHWNLPKIHSNKPKRLNTDIQVDSADGLFLMQFTFLPEHVEISYSGPVSFNLSLVHAKHNAPGLEPASALSRQPHIFYSKWTFGTRDGPLHAGAAQRYWNRDQAEYIADLITGWHILPTHFPPDTLYQIIEAMQNDLWSGFNNLMKMLPAANHEVYNHDIDSARWREVQWLPLMPITWSLGVRVGSVCARYEVIWEFLRTNPDAATAVTGVKIYVRAPVRFISRMNVSSAPNTPQPDNVLIRRHGTWPPDRARDEQIMADFEADRE